MSKILLVDDEPNVRLVYREVLTEKGHEVLEAESGEETFKVLNEENVDLVVLDIKLRLESGLNIKPVITHRYHYTDFQKGFEAMKSGLSGKVVLDWRD